MNQFTLKSNIRGVLFAFMALGVICLGITFFIDDELHTRFWSSILTNATFFTGIAFMSLFLYAAHIVGLSGWQTTFKRVWESFNSFLIPGFIFMIIIALGNYFGFHHLYHWTDESAVNNDAILSGKSSFLNPTWYLLATIIIGGIWILIARRLRTLSLKEDEKGTMEFNFHKRMQNWSAAILPLIGFGSAPLIWLWVMSVDAHWYSTLFGWYAASSWCVAAFCLTILVLIWLKSMGYYKSVTKEHLHDLGKYLFAFSIFWTYLWFSQYMLIWYGNVGEETVYFHNRVNDYPVLFYGNLIINFVLPFLILMRNDTKRKYGTLIFTSAIVLFGHWIDTFLMIKPGVLHTAHEVAGHGHNSSGGGHGTEVVEHTSSFVAGFTMPGLLEIGVFLGFLALFLFISLNTLSNAKLVPGKDPYLEESLHHHV